MASQAVPEAEGGGAVELLAALQAACPGGALAAADTAKVDAFLRAAAKAKPVASRLVLIIDYDLTISEAAAPECHHLLRDAEAMPRPFRDDVHALFEAGDPAHPEHAAIFGAPADASRPHRFWVHYNHLLVKHAVTREVIERAVEQEKEARGTLLRPGFAALLTRCEQAGVLVVILSAGLETVVRAVCRLEKVPLPPSCCRVLTNRLVFDGEGQCIAVEPSNPPASREGKLRLLASLGELADKDLVLMVGDKPVDARVGRGLPPLRRAGARSALALGFFNGAVRKGYKEPPGDVNEWKAAFDILAHRGSECTFAPVVALLDTLLRP